jgi:hypothetical protein
MKKFIYILALLFVITLSVSSCTEEQIKPQDGNGSSGGTVSDPLN